MRRARRAAVAAVAAVGLVACAPAQGRDQTAAATDRCGEVEVVPIQGGAHLIGDRPPPVAYNSVPPTSGWHRSGLPVVGVHGTGDALTEPAQVAVLEAGAVVVAHRGLSDADRGRLEELAQVDHPGRVSVTPYDRLDAGEVVFTSWGALQRCEGVDPEALAAFVASYGADQPAGGH